MGIIKTYKLYEYDKKQEDEAQLADVIEPVPATEANETAIYRVRKGDNLNLIAKKFKTTVTALKQTNRLKNNKLSPGQRLKI
jgi:membrane-bound lytic murein transglycosylase D